MIINWERQEKRWQIFTDDESQKLGLVKKVVIHVPCMLLGVDGQRRGFCVVGGELTIDGDKAVIR